MMKKTAFKKIPFFLCGVLLYGEKNQMIKKKIGRKSHLQSCVLMYTHLEAISFNLAIHTYQDEEEAEN